MCHQWGCPASPRVFVLQQGRVAVRGPASASWMMRSCCSLPSWSQARVASPRLSQVRSWHTCEMLEQLHHVKGKQAHVYVRGLMWYIQGMMVGGRRGFIGVWSLSAHFGAAADPFEYSSHLCRSKYHRHDRTERWPFVEASTRERNSGWWDRCEVQKVVRSTHHLPSAHQHAGLFCCWPVSDLRPFPAKMRAFQHTHYQSAIVPFHHDTNRVSPLTGKLQSLLFHHCVSADCTVLDDRDGWYIIMCDVLSKIFPMVRIFQIMMGVSKKIVVIFRQCLCH